MATLLTTRLITAPHAVPARWYARRGVKVTEMIHHARTDMKKKQGIPLRDQLIGRTGLIGSVMTPLHPLQTGHWM